MFWRDYPEKSLPLLSNGAISRGLLFISMENIKLNEESVHLACRFHGHPAFLFYIDLNVTLDGEDIIYNVAVLPKFVLLLQN